MAKTDLTANLSPDDVSVVEPGRPATNPLTTDFQNGTERWRYDFSLCTIEQVMNADEVLMFKRHQQNKPPAKYESIVLSGMVNPIAKILGYVLTRLNDLGTPLPYNPQTTPAEGERFVSQLPATELPRLEEVLRDFFSKVGKSDELLLMLRFERELDMTSLLADSMRIQSSTSANNSNRR